MERPCHDWMHMCVIGVRTTMTLILTQNDITSYKYTWTSLEWDEQVLLIFEV